MLLKRWVLKEMESPVAFAILRTQVVISVISWHLRCKVYDIMDQQSTSWHFGCKMGDVVGYQSIHWHAGWTRTTLHTDEERADPSVGCEGPRRELAAVPIPEVPQETVYRPTVGNHYHVTSDLLRIPWQRLHLLEAKQNRSIPLKWNREQRIK